MKTHLRFRIRPILLLGMVFLLRIAVHPQAVNDPAGPPPGTPDFSGVWTGIGPGQTESGLQNTPWPEDLPTTAEGAALFASNSTAADPVTSACLPPGLVRTMDSSEEWPTEIVHSPAGLTLLSSRHYLTRRIYTDGRDRLGLYDYWQPTFMGHSLGRWEGTTLVVETERLNEKSWLSGEGLPQRSGTKILERISVIEGGSTLQDRITVVDPSLYTEPLEVVRYWRRTAGVEIGEPSYECQERLNLEN